MGFWIQKPQVSGMARKKVNAVVICAIAMHMTGAGLKVCSKLWAALTGFQKTKGGQNYDRFT